jgi:hypothetical protein
MPAIPRRPGLPKDQKMPVANELKHPPLQAANYNKICQRLIDSPVVN